MLRILYLIPIGALAAFGQEGLPDPAFERVPFDQWSKGGDQARIQFSVRTNPANLSMFQRLGVFFSIEVPATEFAKRPGRGRLLAMLEIRDRDNHAYQMHSQLDFAELKKPSDLAAVNVSFRALLRPGDYRVEAAIYDIETKEHSLKHKTVHVTEIPHDPLPEFWRDLPRVEFLTQLADRPDVWFLPEITSRPHLQVRTERPVRIEVLVNESATEAARGRVGQATRRTMGTLIPALKVLSQMEVENGSLNVTMLDLERRKVSFSQEQVHALDWPKLRAALVETDPNLIDVHALEKHDQNAQFFVSEVRRRLEAGELNGDVPLGLTVEPSRVLIVLSGPMAFQKGQDLHPIEAAPEPGSHVYYIRCYPFTMGGRGAGPPPGPMGRGAPRIQVSTGRSALTEDSLQGTLKPLSPRVFDVTSPLEFRKALGAIMSEISHIK